MNLKTLAFVVVLAHFIYAALVSSNFVVAFERAYFGVITLFCAYLWSKEGWLK